MGAGFTALVCADTSLGARLSTFYEANGGYPLWGLNASEAAILLSVVILITWIMSTLIVRRDKRASKRTQLDSPPPAGVF